ncbi:MAG: hypothetical protein PF961_04890 [Planctomycetota bacterium]|jgi:hypothetical protein|nr:hypothetical protein [Planctomycetota bacterium]
MTRLLIITLCAFCSACGVVEQTTETRTTQTDALTAINDLRAASGVPALHSEQYLVEAATWHSAYLGSEAVLSHGEFNIDNPYYRAEFPDQRVNIAATGSPGIWPNGVTVQYEDVASSYGFSAIDLLWNTVYHRLPMMRSHVLAAGFADLNTARDTFGNTGLTAADERFGYTTIDFTGDNRLPRGVSSWPNAGARDVPTWFNCTSESPNPLAGPGLGSNEAPRYGLVGPPIHVVVPTAVTPHTVSAELRGPLGGIVSTVVLHGGAPSAPGCYSDTDLKVGEIFIIPTIPLERASTYQLRVEVRDDSSQWLFTDWAFTTID